MNFKREPQVVAAGMRGFSLRLLGLGLAHHADTIEALDAAQLQPGVWPDIHGDTPDLFTTLVCAEFFAVSGVSDLEATLDWLEERLAPIGLWWLHDDYGPWVTRQVLRLDRLRGLTAAERFGWPVLLPNTTDRKTGIASFEHFEVCQGVLTSSVGSLADCGLAFIDLAQFKRFNDAQGQAKGDECLKAFAELLNATPGVQPIRDGGDEFLALTPPSTGGALLGALIDIEQEWLRTFATQFPGAPLVRPRALCVSVPAASLANARERLGESMGQLKSQMAADVDDPAISLVRGP